MDSAVCSVCISTLVDELCVPCSNNHKFHRACLLEWATTLHTCPMCREDFEEITVYNKEGKVLQTIKAPTPNKNKHRDLHDVVFDPPYANMACELCHALTDEAHMILCDICDLGFHIYCLRPPLTSIPSGRWECVRCRPETSSGSVDTRNTTESMEHLTTLTEPLFDGFIDGEQDNPNEHTDEISDDEIVSSVDEESDSTSHSEEPVEFDDDEVLENGPDVSHIPSASHSKLTMKDLKKGRSKKKSLKKRMSRKSSAKKSDTTKKRSLRRKRGSKRRSKKRHHKKAPTENAETARNRIAHVCGIDLKHSDKYKVVKRGSKENTSSSYPSSLSKPRIVDRKLDLRGQKWVLPPDSDINAADKPSTSAVEIVEEKPNCGSPSLYAGSLSLLDEIMANQSKVLAPSKLLKINRDGSLGETSDYKKYIERRDKKREKETDSKEVKIIVKEPKPPHDQPTVEKKGQETLAKDESKNGDRRRENNKKSLQHKMEDRKLRRDRDSSQQKPVKLVKKDMAASTCRGKDSTIEPSSSTNSTGNTKRSRWQPVGGGNGSINNANPPSSKNYSINSEVSIYNKNNNSHIPSLKQAANAVVNPFEFLLQQQKQSVAPPNFPNPINFNSSNIDPFHSLSANPAAMQQLLAGAFPTSVSTGNGLLQNMQTLMTSTASTQSIMESAVAAMNAGNKFNAQTSVSSGSLPSNNLLDLINGTAGAANLLPPNSSALLHLNNLQPLANNSNLSTMDIIAQLFNQPTSLPSLNPLFLRPTAPTSQPGPSMVQPPRSNVLAPPPPRQEYKKSAPPPPPPTASDYVNQSSASRIPPNLMDSPMDIEEDDEEPANSTRLDGNKKPNKESRSATVKLADAAMKAALKPYFGKRLISKDEYKDIMKKGVSKLRNCNSLKQGKVDRFVKQYVDVAISKRKAK